MNGEVRTLSKYFIGPVLAPKAQCIPRYPRYWQQTQSSSHFRPFPTMVHREPGFPAKCEYQTVDFIDS